LPDFAVPALAGSVRKNSAAACPKGKSGRVTQDFIPISNMLYYKTASSVVKAKPIL